MRLGVGVIVLLLLVGPPALSMSPLAGEGTPTATVGPWQMIEKVTPDDAHEDGELGNPSHWGVTFGSSLAVDKDTLVVGTAIDVCEMASWAYVFERSEAGGWKQTAKLTPSDGVYASPGDEDCEGFGFSVAVDAGAGVIVVANPGYSVPDERQAGAAYVFERTEDGAWVETAKFVGPIDGDDNDTHGPYFGKAVDVSGGTIVVGAPDDILGPGGSHGSAFVFERAADGTWHQNAKLTRDVPLARSHYGISVAIEDDTLLVGASTSNEAFVYRQSAGTWTEVAHLTPPTYPPHVISSPHTEGVSTEETSSFGRQVALSGDRLVVSTPGWLSIGDIPGMGVTDTGQGVAYVFGPDGAGWWELEARLLPSDTHESMAFGLSVGIDGSTVVVGTPFAFHVPGSAPVGGAYIFQETGGAWVQTARLSGNDTTPGDHLGSAVAVSGDTVVVGAPMDDNRRDGTPPPLDDDGDMPPCLHPDYVWGCDEGQHAGSVYTFQPLGDQQLVQQTWSGGALLPAR